MEPQSEYYSHTEFDLSGDGEGSSYRVPMRNLPNELNRREMFSRGERFMATATLLEVVHGKMMDGSGGDATRLVAAFCFIPSIKKRFENVVINWTFTSDDPAIDVAIEEIAPRGGWVADPITLKLEKTTGVKGSIGASFPPANATVEANHEGKVSKELTYHTWVDGISRMGGIKDSGGHNSVRWVLKANPEGVDGICRMLRVAVLLRRPILPGKQPARREEQFFRSDLKISVEKKGWWHLHKNEPEKAWKTSSPDEAVKYHPDTPSEARFFSGDENNLRATNLAEEIMFMSMSENFEDATKRQEGKKAEVEEKKRREEQKKKQREEKRKADEAKKVEGEPKAPSAADAPAATNSFAHGQGRERDALPSTQTPAWLYVALGILGMYAFQQLMKSWYGGS
ncbi:MAG: hypothetical protein M1822_009677 [Bathelium mastoideum]|nr:MAG: hypothetical protein M1822_009677 [Bathelium mastoideum]